MNKKGHAISDERLDALLATLREEEDEAPQTKPPVINPFRLEMESVRRESRRQARWLTAAVILFVTLTLFMTATAVRIFSLRLGWLLQSPQAQRYMVYGRMLIGVYGHRMAAVTLAALMLLLLGHILCGALMVKYRDRLFPNHL